MPNIPSLPRVSGQVVDAYALPVSDALVRVIWPRFREELVLADIQCNARGQFSFELDLPSSVPTDARVRVVAERFDRKTSLQAINTLTMSGSARPENDPPLADWRVASTIALPLTDLTELTLRLPSEFKDEYSRLMSRARTSLGGLELGELREDAQHKDVSLLAQMLGTNPDGAMTLIMAARVAQQCFNLCATKRLDAARFVDVFNRHQRTLAALLARISQSARDRVQHPDFDGFGLCACNQRKGQRRGGGRRLGDKLTT